MRIVPLLAEGPPFIIDGSWKPLAVKMVQ